MTQWTAEQCTKMQMAGLEAMAGLTGKFLEGLEKVMELNIQTAKATLAQAQDGVGKALSAQNPQEFVDLQMESIRLATDNAWRYWRQRADIMATTRAEFERVAEVQYTIGKDQLQGFIEGVVNGAASDSTSPLAAWQEAVKATTTLYESMQLTAKQALEVAENSINTATEAASNGARRRAALTAGTTTLSRR
ncbi:phasin family protein [Cupriavidus sp. RAF12]|uniref:phasin family protein n=1 Tax=Cupriavidus sp. RAF12 TaxID=3233050 RepID=UPI003F930C9D